MAIVALKVATPVGIVRDEEGGNCNRLKTLKIFSRERFKRN